MFDPHCEAQVRLLLRCLPEVSRYPCFALKGGTAINFFVRDLPRISVDIDLAYLPQKPRDAALAEIDTTLRSLAREITKRVRGTSARESQNEGRWIRLLVSTAEGVVKIEPNLVFRGSVYPPQERDLSPVAERRFEASVRVLSLSLADLYGGKLCAALDRQHPRDLFDVKLLLDNEGVTPEIRRAFVVYLAGHDRPMCELLAPKAKNLRDSFRSQLVGMTQADVSLDDLVAIQRDLPGAIVRGLDGDERAFLLSMKRGAPEWDCLGIPHIEGLPALQWKLQNIRRMDPAKHSQALNELERLLAA